MDERYEFRATKQELMENYAATILARKLFEILGLSSELELQAMAMAQMIALCTWDKQNNCPVDKEYGWRLLEKGPLALIKASEEFVAWLHETFDDDDARLKPFKEFLDGTK